MNLPSNQHGGVSGIIILIFLIVLTAKVGMAIVPAQIGHFQIKKSAALELKKANENKESEKDLIRNLSSQWSVNAYTIKPEDVITVVKSTPGDMSIKLAYEEESNFFGNVFIVNRFDETISAEDAKNITK